MNPWQTFLTARAQLIDYWWAEKSCEQIVKDLSMDQTQVALIRMRDRSLDIPLCRCDTSKADAANEAVEKWSKVLPELNGLSPARAIDRLAFQVFNSKAEASSDAAMVPVGEVKQLCRDYSSRTGDVYIKDVEADLDGLAQQYATPSAAPTSSDAAREAAAKAIYRLFPGAASHPWVNGGNSDKQDEARRYANAALSCLAAPSAAPAQPQVRLPDRVIDCLWQAAGLTTYHPDGDQLEKIVMFAHNVTEEVLARLPSAPAQQEPDESLESQLARVVAQRDYLLKMALAQPAAQRNAIPEDWRKFVTDCAGCAGGMVNGNNLSTLAFRLLSALPKEGKTAPAAGGQSEVERLRQEQAAAVMPLIGPLLDAYEGTQKPELVDLSPSLAHYLGAINYAMENGTAPEAGGQEGEKA